MNQGGMKLINNLVVIIIVVVIIIEEIKEILSPKMNLLKMEHPLPQN